MKLIDANKVIHADIFDENYLIEFFQNLKRKEEADEQAGQPSQAFILSISWKEITTNNDTWRKIEGLLMGCIAQIVRIRHVMFMAVRTRSVLYLRLHLKTACLWKTSKSI
jgi:hypothetical protein